jgi:hypothetical protein
MDYVLQIFQYSLEGYKAYETKKFAEVTRDKLFQLLTLLVASYFLFRIIRG